MKHLSTILITLLLTLALSCGQTSDKAIFREQILATGDTVTIDCDSIFGEAGYFVRLISFDSLLDKEHNAILIFGQKTKGRLEQIYLDTLYSKVGRIEFADYNKDNIKDLLVQNISDVGSNWTYNLFLTDFQGRTLKKVKGFQEIKKPRLNKELGIIESHVSSETNYIEFYRLVNNDSVYKYDILVYDSLDETSEKNYKQALEKIMRR